MFRMMALDPSPLPGLRVERDDVPPLAGPPVRLQMPVIELQEREARRR